MPRIVRVQELRKKTGKTLFVYLPQYDAKALGLEKGSMLFAYSEPELGLIVLSKNPDPVRVSDLIFAVKEMNKLLAKLPISVINDYKLRETENASRLISILRRVIRGE